MLVLHLIYWYAPIIYVSHRISGFDILYFQMVSRVIFFRILNFVLGFDDLRHRSVRLGCSTFARFRSRMPYRQYSISRGCIMPFFLMLRRFGAGHCLSIIPPFPGLTGGNYMVFATIILPLRGWNLEISFYYAVQLRCRVVMLFLS